MKEQKFSFPTEQGHIVNATAYLYPDGTVKHVAIETVMRGDFDEYDLIAFDNLFQIAMLEKWAMAYIKAQLEEPKAFDDYDFDFL